jgi:hypothetical protein
MPGYWRLTLTFYPRRIMRIRYNVWHYSPVAQSVERLAVNQLVAGSSPARGAILDRSRFLQGKRLLFLYTPCFRALRRRHMPQPLQACFPYIGTLGVTCVTTQGTCYAARKSRSPRCSPRAVGFPVNIEQTIRRSIPGFQWKCTHHHA